MIRLHASTLVEILVALVIITLAIGLAATFYARSADSRTDNLLRIHLLLKHHAAKAKRTEHYAHVIEKESEDLRIEREFLPYGTDSSLLLLELKAYIRDVGQVAIYKEVIIRNDGQ